MSASVFLGGERISSASVVPRPPRVTSNGPDGPFFPKSSKWPVEGMRPQIVQGTILLYKNLKKFKQVSV
jgi:hypothetical protein